MDTLVPEVDDWIADVLASLPGAQTVPYPDWGSQTFQVGGKHFGRLGSDPAGRRIVTVKGDPDENAALVQEYDGITPGYYANKRLWISLALDADVPRDVIIETLRTGYAIVRASLTKRVQAELGG
jgi:predicted DNA-binding protein (MmcQ/YjbR family)